MEPALQPLQEILRLNTDLALNCLSGVADEDGAARTGSATNSVAYLTAHMVDARHFMARLLGTPVRRGVEEILEKVNSIDDAVHLPDLDTLRDAWRGVSDHLDACFENVSLETLSKPSGQQFPIEDDSVLGGITFLLHHESYHLGQLGLLRKHLGYEPMSYERT